MSKLILRVFQGRGSECSATTIAKNTTNVRVLKTKTRSPLSRHRTPAHPRRICCCSSTRLSLWWHASRRDSIDRAHQPHPCLKKQGSMHSAFQILIGNRTCCEKICACPTNRQRKRVERAASSCQAQDPRLRP